MDERLKAAGASIPPLCRPGGPESRTRAPSAPCLAPNLIRPSTASRCQATEKVVGLPSAKRLPFEYRGLGAQKLKAFDQPVRAHTVVLPIPSEHRVN